LENVIKVWGIIEGPIYIEDLPEDEEVPEHMEYLLVCKAEIDGEIEPVNFWFADLEQAYEWQKHFSKHIEPLHIKDSHRDIMI
jgi:hypothetical protein